ncbi:hypothetical protein RhiJN_05295 [Ceratobasidium sp. AG-Ba]|nr:hypothetical protein RhiJN_05295 [Ceratobasidium sp. AG-Ba]QRW06209.1 hypothetical protein RhiLY_05208 [Ceratobasidium sp. AG-Ba]
MDKPIPMPEPVHTPKTAQGQDLENNMRGSDIIRTVKVERDMQEVTVEGYRTLGVVSTFIAGIEAQCFSLVPDANTSSSSAVQAITALFTIGLLLSSFGAVTALLAARWFDLLKGDEVDLLNHRWACGREGFSGPSPEHHSKRNLELNKEFGYTHEGALPSDSIMDQVKACKRHVRNWIVAQVIFIPFYLILL